MGDRRRIPCPSWCLPQSMLQPLPHPLATPSAQTHTPAKRRRGHEQDVQEYARVTTPSLGVRLPSVVPRGGVFIGLRVELENQRLMQRVRDLQSEKDYALAEIVRLRAITMAQDRRISSMSLCMNDGRLASHAGMIGYLTGHVAASQEHLSRLNASWRRESGASPLAHPAPAASLVLPLSPLALVSLPVNQPVPLSTFPTTAAARLQPLFKSAPLCKHIHSS